MSVQVGLLTKAPVAEVALEWFFLVVNVAHMPLQIGGDTEGAVAVFTPFGGKMETSKINNRLCF